MGNNRRALSMAVLFAALGALASDARATTYFPISDEELARRSPVIVLAEVLGEEGRWEASAQGEQIFTLVTLRRLEVLKGSLPEERFQLRLPGGTVGEAVSWVPGVPEFFPSQRAVLFVSPFGKDQAHYVLTELALSKFDVLEDSQQALFAVRSMFQSGEERLVSQESLEEAAPDEVRDLRSFLSALRVAGQGRPLPRIERGRPDGPLRSSVEWLGRAWVNLGGREPGNCGGIPCQFRWGWDSGRSPNGVVSVVGAPTNLQDGSNGMSHVAYAIAQWTGIPGTDVRYSGPAANGNVTVNLDVASHPNGAWTTPLGCGGGGGGIGGIAQPGTGPAHTFKGATYFAPQAGALWIRKSECGSGIPVDYFRFIVMHEMGHTLCLNHPDDARSVHSITTPTDWEKAVMRRVLPNPIPQIPQTDDVLAMQYIYPNQQSVGPTPCGTDPHALCLSNGRFRITVEWSRTDGTSGFGRAVGLSGDTGYFWFFDAANVELVVKALDARAVNGNFWVFAGALSNVEYTINVWDTQTGRLKRYVNPNGTLASLADTSAFAGATGGELSKSRAGSAADASAPSDEELYAQFVADKPAPVPWATAACAPGSDRLCLTQNRFEVRVEWRVPSQGRSGSGIAVPVTGDTGYFWFFDSTNVELIIKVLDARVINGKFWVFYGALSNVEYIVTVTDTQTGAQKTYMNPSGTLASVADTSAF